MKNGWRSHVPKLEDLARRNGLDWAPVIFEAVPDSFMSEIAVYGLPVRMPHWSFGARYIYQLVQRHMGYSRLFEVVFPGNPGHAYLASSNGLADNILVTAHVLGPRGLFAATTCCSGAARIKAANISSNTPRVMHGRSSAISSPMA